MKNTLFIFVFLFVAASCFSQAKITANEPCYDVKQQDTVWKISCSSIQQLPNYPGGDAALIDFLKKEITYPKLAKENGIQGKVFITFIIDKSGAVTDIEIRKGVSASQEMLDKYKDNEKQLAAYQEALNSLNIEALRVVKMMPAWTPGMEDGKAVKVRYVLPISYKLG